MGEWRSSPAWGWELQQRNSRNGRPPPPSRSRISAVPSWERRFCTSVCGIPWKRLCETKEVMGMYKNVVQWDDSAALEAFQNAKARFWAETNRLPCDIPLPDPDMYNDEIDYDAAIDPELLADLDKHPPPIVEANNDADNCWSSYEKPKATGWGDAEGTTMEPHPVSWDVYIDKPIVPTGWGDAEEAAVNEITAEPCSSPWKKGDSVNACNFGAWERNGDAGKAWNYSVDWGDDVVQVDSWASGRGDSWNNGWDNSWNNGGHNSWRRQDNRNYEPDRRFGRKRDRGGRVGSRYTRSRYQFYDHQTKNTWRNRARNGTSHPYEQAV